MQATDRFQIEKTVTAYDEVRIMDAGSPESEYFRMRHSPSTSSCLSKIAMAASQVKIYIFPLSCLHLTQSLEATGMCLGGHLVREILAQN
jgi:hypothetical protein